MFRNGLGEDHRPGLAVADGGEEPRFAIGRRGWDERTRAYADRRTREGKTKAEIIRCLKRYIAREVYKALTTPVA